MKSDILNNMFTYFRGLPKVLAAIFKDYAEREPRIRNKARLSPDSNQTDMFQAENDKENELQALRDEVCGKLAEVRGQLESREAIADKELDKALGMTVPGPDVTANLLSETREQKAWARIKPILDKHSSAASVIQEIKSLTLHFIAASDTSPGAYDSSDYDSIGCLKKEIPFYFKSRFDDQESKAYLAEAIDAIESAMADLRPEFKEAVEMKQELRSGVIQINTALNYIQAAVKNNELDVLVPAWKKGETINLS